MKHLIKKVIGELLNKNINDVKKEDVIYVLKQESVQLVEDKIFWIKQNSRNVNEFRNELNHMTGCDLTFDDFVSYDQNLYGSLLVPYDELLDTCNWYDDVDVFLTKAMNYFGNKEYFKSLVRDNYMNEDVCFSKDEVDNWIEEYG